MSECNAKIYSPDAGKRIARTYRNALKSRRAGRARYDRLFTIGVALKVGHPDESSCECWYGYRGARSQP